MTASVEWRSVVGFEGDYEVSCDGQVRSIDRTRYVVPTVRNKPHIRIQKGKLLKPMLNSTGYYEVVLWNKTESKHKRERIAVIVAQSFIGPRPNGFYVCHANGVRTDNRVENLYYGTPKQNCADKVRHDTQLHGERIPWATLTEEDVRFIRSKRGEWTQAELAIMFDVGQGHISRIHLRKEWAYVE